jgi:hypothetical protein
VRILSPPVGSRRARRAIWTELSLAGVDVIADVDQDGLVRHLRKHPARPPAKGTAPAPRAAQDERQMNDV